MLQGWRKAIIYPVFIGKGSGNQIIFSGLRSGEDYFERPGGVVGTYGKGHLVFLRGPMCAEGMGCRRRWIRWVLRGTGTARMC